MTKTEKELLRKVNAIIDTLETRIESLEPAKSNPSVNQTLVFIRGQRDAFNGVSMYLNGFKSIMDCYQ
jgi:hypothetical protein